MSVAPGQTLREVRERKPLVHQITNYVVMNETANATLSLGALPVMAHAPQEVEEMAAMAGALVLNIGTLSEHWIEAMLLAGKAAGGRSCSTRSVRARRATGRKRRSASSTSRDRRRPRERRGDCDPCGPRSGDPGRRVDRRGGFGRRPRPGRGGDARDAVAAVTGPTDYVSDGERVIAVSNGHELLGTVSGTGCMSTAITGAFLAAKPDQPLEAAAEALVAFGVAGEDAARDAKGPGTFHALLYDALYNLDPDTLDSRARVQE